MATNTTYAPLQNHPRFIALVREMAEFWVARIEPLENPTQLELIDLARVYLLLERRQESLDVFDRALVVPGPSTRESVEAEIQRFQQFGLLPQRKG